MDARIFLDLLMDTLQREDPLTLDMKLSTVAEWDSMSAMAVVALADRKFSKKITLSSLKNINTVDDLYVLLNK